METTEMINNEVIEETTETVAKICNGNGLWIGVGVVAAAAVGGIIFAGKKFVAPKITEFKANREQKKRSKVCVVEPVVVDAEVSEE